MDARVAEAAGKSDIIDRVPFSSVWRTFLGELDEQGRIDWEETFADGSFAPAKKGATASEKPNAERVRSGWWWQAARVFLWEFNLPRRPRTKRR